MDELYDSVSAIYIEGGCHALNHPHIQEKRYFPFHVFLQVEKGNYEVCLNGKWFVIKQGMAILIPAGTPHDIRMQADGILNWGHIRYPLLGAIDFLSLFRLPLLFDGETADSIGSLCGQMSQLFKSQDINTIRGRITQKRLLFDLLDTVLGQAQAVSDDLLLFNKLSGAIVYVTQHMNEPIKVEDMAQSVDISVSRFHRLFRLAVGCTPQHYIKAQKLEEACRLLLFTDLQIGEIAGNVGFNDPLYFSKVFHQEYGTSPTAYRDNHTINRP